MLVAAKHCEKRCGWLVEGGHLTQLQSQWKSDMVTVGAEAELHLESWIVECAKSSSTASTSCRGKLQVNRDDIKEVLQNGE
jgi:hypothetical protein